MAQIPSVQFASSRPVRADQSAPKTKVLGAWCCERLLAEGPLTNTYLARPATCPAEWPLDYVVKVLKSSYEGDSRVVTLLQREALIASTVSHPNLVSALSSQIHEPPYFVVFPRLEAVPLQQPLSNNQKLNLAQILWATRQVAEALQALHQAGWIHNDVKPDNILLSSVGHVTLIDLGFASSRHESSSAIEKPFAGSFHYVAPERFSSRLATDQRSDIYSLGATLFECLAGCRPFEAKSAAGLIEAHRQQPPPQLRRLVPHVPLAVTRLVHNMLRKDPLRRPQSTGELIGQLISLEIENLEGHCNELESFSGGAAG